MLTRTKANWDELNDRVMPSKQEEKKTNSREEGESIETEHDTVEAGTSPKVPTTWTREVIVPQQHDKTAALSTGDDELDEIL